VCGTLRTLVREHAGEHVARALWRDGAVVARRRIRVVRGLYVAATRGRDSNRFPAVVTANVPFQPLKVQVLSVAQCVGVIVTADSGPTCPIMPPCRDTHRSVPATPINPTIMNLSVLASTSNCPVRGWNRSVF
jgi:hypothetical protein